MLTARRLETFGATLAVAALAGSLLSLAPTGAPSAAAAEPQPVIAADFEDGTLGGLEQSGGAAGTLSVVDLGATPADGRALLVRDRDADYVGVQTPAGAFAGLDAGDVVTASMRVRLAEGTPGTAGVRFVMKPAYTWIGAATMRADAWTTVTGTYTVPAGADATALQLYLGTGDEPGVYSYLVDDLAVSATAAGDPDPGPDPDPDTPPGGAVNPTVTPVTRAQGTGDVAALTFDDGPNGADTAELLDVLRERDLRAVFCVIGQNVTAPGGAELLRRIVAEGHTLCNHSTTYDDMGGLTTAQAQERMAANLDIIRAALGDPDYPVPYFRAPNGSWGNTPAAAVALGMQPLGVVNTINDWAESDPEVLTANLRAAMKPGELVLVHDGGGDRSASVQAVRTVLDERLAAGWRFTLPLGAPAAPVEGPLLSTDFEDGLDGWGPRDSGSGAPEVAITTAQAHGGAQAAIVTGRTSQGSGIAHDVTGILQPGTTYELSAWLRFGAEQPVDDVWLSLARTVDGATTYQTLGQFDGMSSSAWVQVTQSFTMGAADSAVLYFETDYNGTNTSDLLIDDIVVSEPDAPQVQDLLPIKDTVDVPVGVAIDSRETVGAPAELLLRHFDQVTSENFMKPEAWYDAEGNFASNDEADTLMRFAQDEDLAVYGHTLVWHSQTPAWFFQDEAGAPLTTSAADRAVLRERMRTHIDSVAKHLSDTYGEFGSASNPLYAFDVVNEVVADSADFADGLRRSEWYRILGEEFIDLAFQYADEAFNETYAAPGAERPVTLFINDYNTEQGGKQQRLHALVERLLERGVPVDGVGHQFHVSLSMPVSALDAAITAFEDLPVTQAVTELDVTTGTPVTEANLIEQGYYYRDAFRSFRAHAESLFSVTVWGLTDGRSWRASSGDPLVFDDALQAKPAYYGIVDGEIPARQRTANVFREEVALAEGATTALRWRQLPLLPIDGGSAFQLRWSPDDLTAYVRVADAQAQAGDAVELQLGRETYRVGRDGSTGAGVDAVVEPVEGGYAVVVQLALDGAAQGDQLAFDVRVVDGGDEAGWNTPGELGTLTLIEPLSTVDVPEAGVAPQIDGEVDAGWAASNPVTTGKQVTGTDGAGAEVRTLWQDDLLYILAEVRDPQVDVSGSDPWIQDSVEIYVDPGNAKNGSYRYDDTQIRISAENSVSFGTGDEAFQRARVISATRLVDGGYVVEAAISLLEYGGEGTFHGVDFQVNDAAAGARSSIRNWADPSGAGYQSTARWGVARLVGPASTTPTIELDSSRVRAGDRLGVALAGFEPGSQVELVLGEDGGVRADASASAGAGAAALAAAAADDGGADAVLASVTIGDDGMALTTVRIPATTAPGAYRLAAVDGGVVLADAGVEVLAAGAGAGAGDGAGGAGGAADGDGLALSGVELGGILALMTLLLAAGVGLVVLRARRARQEDARA